ncbi:Solute-binding protein [Neomoorella glycerini]|uniref:Solute-binding protein n=1 Tax=Neomoorella glycerini TaxID=55779 RepID=A0A6I5ZNL1_9FIRM|nr:TRAP transporter substrate-binding protein [Moorella glycerini]QGP91510.1 Solute-binding protein [Moorella glycerini]
MLLALVASIAILLAGCGGGNKQQATVSGGASPQSNSSSVINLKLHHHEPPGSRLNQALLKWADMVNQRTEGRLKITVYPGEALGKGKDTYSIVTNGIADIGWLPTALMPGKFPLTEVANLPLLGINSSKTGAKIMWELYQTNPEIQKEYSEVKLLSIFCSGYQLIGTAKKPINKLEDLKGLKLRTGGYGMTEFLKLVGGSPMNIPPPELYESIEKGVLDGFIFDWQGINSNRLYEVMNYAVDVSVAVIPQVFIMNKQKWDSLPPDIQKVLDELSGVQVAELVANQAYDAANQEGRDYMQKRNKQVRQLTSEEEKQWQEAAKPVWDKWVAEQKAKGLDGQKALDQVLQLVTKYKQQQ